MSAEKATSPCNKFQANIFNKSKCQNCFKSRELHLLTDHDMEQAKPVYGGWLCLAPEGTDFDNPMQRSRKWQRRFFILYEDGGLSFALDELPSTLPQGTVNMNLCSDITDAEPRTGQRNALCVVTPEQEIFIRGDNKEIINGWSEQLAVYLRANKQNLKKKRKVERVATQEPSPAKMAATESSFPSPENAAESGCARWQEDQQGPGVTPVWTGSERTPTAFASTRLGPDPGDSLTFDGLTSPVGSLDLVAGNDQLTDPNDENQHRNKSHGSPAERILGLEAVETAQEEEAAVSRKGRSDARGNKREKLHLSGDAARLGAPPPQRRARSLDRRTSDTFMTPDLLNFKKGWMVKLEGSEQWKKYWFVLSADSLRYYKDSIAEEASDLEGEIDLTKCYGVSEYQVQRNYGFQIHTPNGVSTLSAMTSGIRKNWIQALMKNVHPGHAPDVTSLPGHRGPCSPPDALPKPDVTRDSKHRTVMERRREGRYKTFDWAEFRPQNRPTLDPDPQRTGAPRSPELGDLERRKRREERRRRYESMLGISLCRQAGGEKPAGGGGGVGALKVEEDVEECWRLVEMTAFRPDRAVPLLTEDGDPAAVDRLLDGCRKEVEVLKAQLEDSECRRLELQVQLATTGHQQQKLDPPPSSEADIFPNEKMLKSQRQTLNEAYGETREQSVQEQLGAAQTPSVWLHDAQGNIQELGVPAPDSQDLCPRSDGETECQTQLDRVDSEQDLSSDTQINGECSSFTLEEQVGPADQAVVTKLSQEVAVLTSQNEALNQRNQEMLNQLTEADREIERLKAELSSRYSEPYRFPEEEQLERAGVEVLDRELSLRNQELLEAQTLIASLEENLRETEALLQLTSAADSEGAGRERSALAERAGGYLLCCLEANEAKLSELERRLAGTEASCGELREQNEELQEAEKRHRQAAAEAEADIRRLNQELEEERSKGGDDRRVSGEERVQQVIEGAIVRLNALEKLLEVIDTSDVGWRTETEETVASQLKWEEEFWSSVHSKLNSSQLPEEERDEELLREATERMIVENQMLLLGHSLLPETKEGRTFDLNNQLWEIKHFRVVTQMKISSLNRLASTVIGSAQDGVQPMEDRPCSSRPWSGFIHSAATEALYCCLLNRLQSRHERELEELTSCRVCSSGVDLKLEEQRWLAEKRSTCCQTEEIQLLDRSPEGLMEEEEARKTAEDAEEETAEPLPCVEGQLGGREERDAGSEAEQVLVLSRQVKELEEQLNLREEELKEQHEEKMSSVQTQHEREMEKLKVAFERGFASMEESHVKIVEELQRRHRQEEERLLLERERLLEEETVATATAIEAIRSAHRQELEKEVQRRCRSEERAGGAHLEDVYRQHSEELTSFQRELQVLSQQFSLKCLENGHLVQALDAERKALCQCQQENQDLRTRNQELSGHLAAEITRLCSLAKQDELPLSRGMDVYELEITLRVKESEVQCLKQEVTSLKDELQSAQRDKRNATKKYKDVFTELSVTRAKAERELDELRENLRLAHRALDPDSP